jgi:predicted amidophosphoribosyltransferase
MDAPACRLCGAALLEDHPRCPNCGLHRVSEFGRAGYRHLAVGLAGVYALTAVLVLLTRSR